MFDLCYSQGLSVRFLLFLWVICSILLFSLGLYIRFLLFSWVTYSILVISGVFQFVVTDFSHYCVNNSMSERRSVGDGRRGAGDARASGRSVGDDRRGGCTSVTGGSDVGFSSIGHRGSSSSVRGRGDSSERSLGGHVGTRVTSGECRTTVDRGAGLISSSDERRIGIVRGVNAGEGSSSASG